MSDRPLLVAEIFGPTWQGEGPNLGQTAAFLRLSRCNLQCGKGGAPFACDTPFTWDTSRYDLRAETRRMSQEEVFAELKAIPASRVVITGGEPLLQQDRLVWIVDMCRAIGRPVEIETNGTVVPSRPMLAAVKQWNVSPKLANSGMPASRRVNPEALRVFARSGAAIFKFVAARSADLEEVAEFEAEHGLKPIWIMPEGTTPQAVLDGMKTLADDVLKRGWNLTTRLHVLLWGDERGR